jgi:hypothetical protein
VGVQCSLLPPDEEARQGVATHSGNHAAAVALAGIGCAASGTYRRRAAGTTRQE